MTAADDRNVAILEAHAAYIEEVAAKDGQRAADAYANGLIDLSAGCVVAGCYVGRGGWDL